MRTFLSNSVRTERLTQLAAWALVAAVGLMLSGAALAQQNEGGVAATEVAQGTQIILPDGTRCLPLPPAERGAVAGATLEYYCGDGIPKGLVGGVLESAGQVSLEVASLAGDADGGSVADVSKLALFSVQRLVLADGAVCVPTEDSVVAGTELTARYECEDGATRFVVLGSFESEAQDGYATSFVNVAPLNTDGAVAGATQRVAVALIDGALPLTKTEWVLASWGTGQAPPIAGAAPTLAFSAGMVNGRTGCNSYFAPATSLTDGQLELGVIGSTLMACPEELMAQETRFLAALDGVVGYELIAGDLYLYGGAEVVRFTPAAP
jgi:heat shock protein HslJ